MPRKDRSDGYATEATRIRRSRLEQLCVSVGPLPNTLDSNYFANIIETYRMTIRTNRRSSSPIGRIRDRIRSTLFAADDTPADDTADEATDDQSATNPDAPGNLFHCSACGTVYIAAEKHVCSNCDVPVEEVRSTLA